MPRPLLDFHTHAQIEKATRGDREAMDAILFDNGAELLRRAGATVS